jgi:hypothetical protein
MTRHRVISIVVRVGEYALGGLFLYLGTTKFLGAGASTLARVLMASAEVTVGVLILLRVSEMLATPACISAHGLTTWGRIRFHRR